MRSSSSTSSCSAPPPPPPPSKPPSSPSSLHRNNSLEKRECGGGSPSWRGAGGAKLLGPAPAQPSYSYAVSWDGRNFVFRPSPSLLLPPLDENHMKLQQQIWPSLSGWEREEEEATRPVREKGQSLPGLLLLSLAGQRNTPAAHDENCGVGLGRERGRSPWRSSSSSSF